MTEFAVQVPDIEAQQRLGAELGRALTAVAAGRPGALLVFLQGELGTGKTTLVRGLLRGRGYAGAVRSPTFTLIEPYETVDGRIYHLDLYRLADGEELEYLGLRDLLAEPALLLIEWPERGAGWLPEPDLLIELWHAQSGRRLRLQAAPALDLPLASALRRFGSEKKSKK